MLGIIGICFIVAAVIAGKNLTGSNPDGGGAFITAAVFGVLGFLFLFGWMMVSEDEDRAVNNPNADEDF
jgi:hypothetical protein